MPKTHLFVLAVDSYQDLSVQGIDFAELAARSFVQAWQALGVDAADSVALLGGQATLAVVKSRLNKFVKNVGAGERVIFYFGGHGGVDQDTPFLAVSDTQWEDLEATSLPLREILKALQFSVGTQKIVFMDPFHKNLSAGAKSASGDNTAFIEELRSFCDLNESHVAFMACKGTEVSYSSHSLKMGIWNHCLIRAIQGEVKGVLTENFCISGSRLQSYLQEEVPRFLRTTITGVETQSPAAFGVFSDKYVLADLTQLFENRVSDSGTFENTFKEATLCGRKFGEVRRLSGFKKGHRIPDAHSRSQEAYVQSVGTAEVKAQADHIYENIRKTFGFKRKDVHYECLDGMASITTPDFDVNVSIGQDAADPSSYALVTEVGVIRRPAVVSEDSFSELFENVCDTLVVLFAAPIQVEDKIDALEEVPEMKEYLSYEPNASSFTLDWPTPRVRIHVTDLKMTFTHPGSRNLKELFKNAERALSALSGEGVSFHASESSAL